MRHLQVHGKGSKIRYVPLHTAAAGAITAYLEAAGHGDEKAAPLFRPVSNNARSPRAITPDGIYKVLIRYACIVGIDVEGFGPHALRATAATNALEHDADIAKVQQWLGHANISTTRVYDRRQMRAEDSPTFQSRVLKAKRQAGGAERAPGVAGLSRLPARHWARSCA